MLKPNSTENFLVPDAAVVYKKKLLHSYACSPITAILRLMSLFNVMLRPACPIPVKNVQYVETFETIMANRWSIQLTISRMLKENLKQNLTCSNYKIYAAQSKICQKIYVGQTINHFYSRWSGHRAF